jgi:hypothetical protein
MQGQQAAFASRILAKLENALQGRRLVRLGEPFNDDPLNIAGFDTFAIRSVKSPTRGIERNCVYVKRLPQRFALMTTGEMIDRIPKIPNFKRRDSWLAHFGFGPASRSKDAGPVTHFEQDLVPYLLQPLDAGIELRACVDSGNDFPSLQPIEIRRKCRIFGSTIPISIRI